MLCKSNINNIDYADILKFLKLKGYTYDLKNEKGKKYGVIAQELEELGLGSIVDNTDEYKRIVHNGGDTFR